MAEGTCGRHTTHWDVLQVHPNPCVLLVSAPTLIPNCTLTPSNLAPNSGQRFL